MKRILLIILSIFILSNIKAQSSCGLPSIIVTAIYDKHGRLMDSCDNEGKFYYYFNYHRIPQYGSYYVQRRIKRKKYTFIFINGYLADKLNYNPLRVQAGSNIPTEEWNRVSKTLRIGTIPDTSTIIK